MTNSSAIITLKMSEFDDANVVLCVDVDSDMNRKKKEAKLAKMADAYRTILEVRFCAFSSVLVIFNHINLKHLYLYIVHR